MTLIFDLGNTLVKFTGDVEEVNRKGVELMHRVFSLEGIHIEFDDLLRVWTEERLKAFKKADETLKEVTADEVLDKTLSILQIENVPESIRRRAVDAFFTPEIEKYVLFPDTLDVLSYLKEKGHRLGLISNSTCHRFVLRLMEKHGLNKFFNEILSSAGEGIRKPHPEIFRRALERLESYPEETIMVGDLEEYDVKGAKSVGMKAILFNPEWEGDTEADWVITRLSEIKNIL